MNTAFIKKLHNGENLPPKQTSVESVPAKVDINNIVLHRYIYLLYIYARIHTMI